MKSSIIFVTLLVSHIACLSLDDIHSSSQTFKSVSHNNKDKSLKTAIDTIRKRRQEYPIAQLYGPYSLPLKSYEGLVPYNKISDQQVIDDLLGFATSKQHNQIDAEYLDESLNNDLLSSDLALKLSELLDNRQESDVGHRVYNRINRKWKRSISKQNNYFNQMNAINNKRKHKHLKNVKIVNKQKNNSIKTLTKRKSGRRVLNDHFNIEENHQNVITNKNKETKTSLKPMKLKVMSHKKFQNNENSMKKRITKRKVELSMTTDATKDMNSGINDSMIATKELKTTDKTVVLELNDILSEDNKTDKNQKKTLETKTGKTNLQNSNSLENKNKKKSQTVRKMAKRNDPIIDPLVDNSEVNKVNDKDMSNYIIVYPNDDKTQAKDENKLQTNKDMDEWLRREFYENMAKTLATMRKKRSEDFLNDESDALNSMEESETIGDNIIAVDDKYGDRDNTENEELKNFRQLTDDSDNDYVIAAMDDDFKDHKYANVKEDSDDNEEEYLKDSIDWNDLEEKSKTVKRSVSSYSEEPEENIESNEINSNRFNRVYNNLESIEDSLLNEALDLIRETAAKGSQTEVNSNKIGNRLDAAYDIEDMRTALDDLKNTFDKIKNEKDDEVVEVYEIDSTPPVYTTPQIEVHKKDSLFDDSTSESDSDSKCIGLDTLSSDCSSVADLLPSSELRYSFTESCNWHQICYTCGEIYGLLSSDCDAGFLEASRLSCAGSPSCEAFARLILAPLRQSRVFYKSSVPQICYRYHCIKDFLFDSQNNKR